ncbi:MAG: ribosome maturation factor RimM [bacterium]|nr:ribosome maturation factor RimM [bacterium]
MKVLEMTDIYLGRIVKAFGIRGELKFHPSEDFWEEVLESRKLELYSENAGKTTKLPFELVEKRPHGTSYVVKLKGVDNRNRAEELVGSELFVDGDALDVALPYELLPFQVVGMTVKDEAGNVLGRVTRIVFSAAHDVYEVERDGGTFMVPAIPEFVVDVNEDEGEMTIRPLPGLIEDE